MSGYCKCGDCIFWERTGTHEGVCRRHAPLPGFNADDVAYWPETYVDNGCGEGTPAEPGPVDCANCAFWDPRTGGLAPQDRHGETTDWWRHAGHCFRYAPLPSKETGARGFRPATSARDCCGDGKVERTS